MVIVLHVVYRMLHENVTEATRRCIHVVHQIAKTTALYKKYINGFFFSLLVFSVKV